jgi:hypothetical protein
MWAAVAMLCAASARAQQTDARPNGPTGSVAGYVDFGESQLPARFAEIRLVPKPDDADMAHAEDSTVPPETRTKHVERVLGVSGMDGRFRIDGVPPGDYLAGALMPGYVIAGVGAGMYVKGDQLKMWIGSLPTVHVLPGQVSSLNLTLHRGAVITGQVQFADGSPAVGVQVGWELLEKDLALESVRLTWPSPLQQVMQQFDYTGYNNRRSTTDDKGRYRIFGLPPGKYIVSTVISSQIGSGHVAMSDGSGYGASSRNRIYPNMTTVYGPGVFRRREAKVFEIRGEEQVADADLKIDVSGLYTITGKVLAGEDRHVPSQAMVRLKEGGRDLPSYAEMEEDGTFQINYVPSGSYTLVVLGSPDMTVPTNLKDAPRPLQAKVPVVVGANNVVLGEVVLMPLKPGEKMEY